MNDKKFTKWVKNKYSNLKGRDIVFMTHGPPYKSGIDSIGGEPVGNKSYKKFIDKAKPKLVISGHLHENFGKKFRLKGIEYINPSPLGKIIKI